MNIVDVLIHVNEALDNKQRVQLEQTMRDLDGVIAPRFNPEHPHLMLVAFNPKHVQSRTLLQQVSSVGYHAQLIGV
ncbi:MAG: hypothetical protein OQL09_07160 [Gammaproteobacteria bacterium]|nr:hypothetical protein [Gammaproteobacteria bacterium]